MEHSPAGQQHSRPGHFQTHVRKWNYPSKIWGSTKTTVRQLKATYATAHCKSQLYTKIPSSPDLIFALPLSHSINRRIKMIRLSVAWHGAQYKELSCRSHLSAINWSTLLQRALLNVTQMRKKNNCLIPKRDKRKARRSAKCRLGAQGAWTRQCLMRYTGGSLWLKTQKKVATTKGNGKLCTIYLCSWDGSLCSWL